MTVDHLVYGTPDLEAGVAEIENLIGVRATYGGRHPGRGTQNALISLGPAAYLEILGPDPTQTDVPRPLWFNLDRLEAPRLVAWAAKNPDLDQLAADALRNGIPLGDVGQGSRKGPEGEMLRWRFTDPTAVIADGLVPFFIDWGDSPHPAATAPGGATLVLLRGQHPDPKSVRSVLDALSIEMAIEAGDRPRLIAEVQMKRGRVVLE